MFVLIPAGRFWMGAQKTDVGGRNYDPAAAPEESPVHEVALDFFFLSKYEMSQAQWLGFTGRNPSMYGPDTRSGGRQTTLLHPVEQVSWSECQAMLGKLGLVLPTEAQWEYGARAGSSTIWWTGSDRESLRGAAKLSDGFAKRNEETASRPYETWLDDGYTLHAPVGIYRANDFGLHDVIGNVMEFCRDAWGRYDLPAQPGDGERGIDPRSRMVRGRSYFTLATRALGAARRCLARLPRLQPRAPTRQGHHGALTAPRFRAPDGRITNRSGPRWSR